jgi:2-amino-4-hydroxy-6-hydroxymethyldihydropteridine diphosphokinase
VKRLCHIALGSNLGDRAGHLQAACGLLPVCAASAIYETDPVDCPAGSLSFFNAVVAVEWAGSAEELHGLTKEIEGRLGRPEVRGHHAPRVIDLDLLTFGQEVIATETLQIPHPRLHVRRFVLQPLVEISPDLILPGSAHNVAYLLSRLDSPEPALRPILPLCLLPPRLTRS